MQLRRAADEMTQEEALLPGQVAPEDVLRSSLALRDPPVPSAEVPLCTFYVICVS